MIAKRKLFFLCVCVCMGMCEGGGFVNVLNERVWRAPSCVAKVRSLGVSCPHPPLLCGACTVCVGVVLWAV